MKRAFCWIAVSYREGERNYDRNMNFPFDRQDRFTHSSHAHIDQSEMCRIGLKTDFPETFTVRWLPLFWQI
jgi:hypothetical protein